MARWEARSTAVRGHVVVAMYDECWRRSNEEVVRVREMHGEIDVLRHALLQRLGVPRMNHAQASLSWLTTRMRRDRRRRTG